MSRKKHKSREGVTLIETMVAMLVLVVLVIGGSATLSHSGSMVVTRENQRAALAAATTVMEENIKGIGVAGLVEDAIEINGYSLETTVESPGDGYVYVRVLASAAEGAPTIDPFSLCYRELE